MVAGEMRQQVLYSLGKAQPNPVYPQGPSTVLSLTRILVLSRQIERIFKGPK